MKLSLEELEILIKAVRGQLRDYYLDLPDMLIESPEGELMYKLVTEYKERKKKLIEK